MEMKMQTYSTKTMDPQQMRTKDEFHIHLIEAIQIIQGIYYVINQDTYLIIFMNKTYD